MRKCIYLMVALLFAGLQTVSAQEIMIFDGKAIPVEKVDSITAGKTRGNVIGDQLWRNEQLSIFASALKATGIEDTLSCYLRDDYKETGMESSSYSGRFREWPGIWAPVPHHRYTVFIEPDSVYKANGIGSLDDLRAYAKKVYDEVFPEDAGVQDEKDPRNSLHRFVAYHVLEYGAPLNQYAVGDGGDSGGKVIYRTGVQYVEHYQTLMPEALLKISQPSVKGRLNFYLNRNSIFNDFNGRENIAHMQESDYGVRVNAEASIMAGNAWINGYAYALDSILVYDKKTVDQRSSERMRFDMASISPELMANGLRLNREYGVYYFPNGYFKNISWDDQSGDFFYAPNQGYMSGLFSWLNVYGDEWSVRGITDLTITLPVVPAGTYELRIGHWITSNRGTIQYYLDGEPCGEPLDLSYRTFNIKELGWIPSQERVDSIIYADSWNKMRSNGWMYAPHWLPLNRSYNYMDESQNSLRRIIGTFISDGKTAHTLRMKQILDDRGLETFLDYLELCPECIYNNPDKMEDRW